MKITFISMLLAFVEGFLLILSPCILPILPLVLTGSLSGNKSKPFGIIIGFILTFTLFTLFAGLLITWLGIDPTILRNIAFLILLLIGIVMISNYLSNKFSVISSQLITKLKINQTKPPGNLGQGLLFGGLLGIIWTPCAGPLLAAVIVQSALQKTTFSSVLVTLAFAIGIAVPMLLIALLGRRVTHKFTGVRRYSTMIRKILGVLIILGTILLYNQNWFTKLSANLYSPSFTSSANVVKPYAAPPLAGIIAWINSPPLELQNLKGKVVLIDFWTYSCINCIRTLPHLKSWYEKYHDKGLIIIGVHSPEFAFEQNLDNVVAAVRTYQITYPVALDNNFVSWENYRNRYWPSHYLIDKNGNVVYEQFGEGHYTEMENKIRHLLGLAPLQLSNGVTTTPLGQTPEIYLGFARAATFANTETPKIKQSYRYQYPASLPLHSWALQGTWIIQNDKIISAATGATIKLHFRAKNVYAVMGSNKAITLMLSLDGKPQSKAIIVKDNRLYELLNLPQNTNGVLEIKVDNPGLELYTFTFG